MLTVSDISYSINGKVILKNINLEVGKGQIVGLLGPSGSGKTTLLKHVIGTLPSFGKILLNGQQVPFADMYKNVGYMLQSDALYDDLSCMDNMLFFARVFGLNNPIKAANDALEVCELVYAKKTIVRNMSGGMKRRLSLAIALVNRPSFLILDEPTVGIDPVLRQRFWLFFNKIKSEQGVSIIVTTHVMSDAEECDKLYIMFNGVIASHGSANELKAMSGTDNMDKTYAILSSKVCGEGMR
ncbi:MAG: ABC transporter ATP-binding protein [Alphaproteobacteria bacterium]|nr:ABC transporter ATP-binding protein [Rickettsiales bacterium]